MSRIRFLSDQVYDTGAPGKGPAFAKGSVLSLHDVPRVLQQDVSKEHAEGFLQRWLRRGVAVRIPDDEPDDLGAFDVDYEKLTRAELDALAAERGIDVASAKNKGDVIAALQLADEAAREPAGDGSQV